MNPMKKVKAFLLGILMLLLNISIWGIQTKAADQDKRVLFIGSYSYAVLATQEQIEGIKIGLNSDIIIDYEFMDSGIVYDDKSIEMFYEQIKYKLENTKPYDVVILGDDAAFSFGIEYRDELFKDTPILYLGVNDESFAKEVSLDPMITGIIERFSYNKNIDLGLKLFPNAEKVYAIIDNSVTGCIERENYYSISDSYPDLDFEEINPSTLTSTQFKIALQKIEKDSIVLYISSTQDASGKKYTDEEAINVITNYTPVPVFRMVDVGIGMGLLGGYAVSMAESGRLIGQMASAIINGRDPASIHTMHESVNFYYMDLELIKKFGLSKKGLPGNTIYINAPVSFYERNKEALIPAYIVGGFMIIIICIFLYDNLRRRKLQREFMKTKDMLERASEHDFLTDLPNRSKFMLDLNKMITDGRACTVFMMDIDDFKSINDTYGHSAGDEALVELATRLKSIQSQILTPYRLAGDEFIMILESSQGRIVEKTAYQCRELFVKPFKISKQNMKVCGSIGIASFPHDASDAEQVVICADKAMYAVKKSGKNDYAFYNPDEDTKKG